MPTYNLFSDGGTLKKKYANVESVATTQAGQNQVFVKLADDDGELIAIINLAPGERIERVPE